MVDDAGGLDGGASRLAEAGRAFLSAAWRVLLSQRVVPPPRFHPYVEVGRDYFGADLSWLPEYRGLEEVIKASHPRFDDAVPLMNRRFPAGYIFSFLETFIARLTIDGETFSSDSRVVDEALRHLGEAIHADSVEVACSRLVSYMTTADGQPIDFTDVHVVPVIAEPSEHRRQVNRIIGEVIPGAVSAYSRAYPEGFAPPESVLIAKGRGVDPFGLSESISGRIERFLLLVRLLRSGTSESMLEVQGETRLVRRFNPTLVRFRGEGASSFSPTQLAPRVVTLCTGDVGRVEGLGRLLGGAQQERPGMVFTSFAMAQQKFILSYHSHAWYEQIVDLATAFEAALSGAGRDDVTLRLKTRAAALLATDRDSSAAIFNDIGHLYGLRSTLVHGGEMTAKALGRAVRKITTVPDVPLSDRELAAHAVERLRDLVRRSLLVRIGLAAGDVPLWSLGADGEVDATLADDAGRVKWRNAWRDTLASIDAHEAVERPVEPGVA
ncbi:hypothetical protein [Longispora urticae]